MTDQRDEKAPVCGDPSYPTEHVRGALPDHCQGCAPVDEADLLDEAPRPARGNRLAPCASCGEMTRARVIWDQLPDEFTPCCRKRSCRDALRTPPVVVEHELVGEGFDVSCSCGGWTPALGESTRRSFDRHLLDVRG